MYTFQLDEAVHADVELIGGKTHAIACLHEDGQTVPRSICITTEAYNTFLDQCGLREKIFMELSRKNFEDMRWEEIWDTALRIRKYFVNTDLPPSIAASLEKHITRFFSDKMVAVRSSSPEEDTAESSFAGLHESYLNVFGIDNIIDHIKKVWASLWSDAALLYRQEIGLDPQKSSIAVLVQEMVSSDVSGVMFSRSPNDNEEIVIEAVHGLNQGLVDGTVEPDRWHVRINDRTIISHNQAVRDKWIDPGEKGAAITPLPGEKQSQPPLTAEQVLQLADKALSLEEYFGKPQDIEWTITGSVLYLLQSRPITTGRHSDADDSRSWYLSQRRSFDNLKALHKRIGTKLLPEMDAVARQLAATKIENLHDNELVEEIRARNEIHAHWLDVYWTDFIPFAHGMRLFGQVYNDRVKPEEPYEFISLLCQGKLESIRRNELLERLSEVARSNAEVRSLLNENRPYLVQDRDFVHFFEELQKMFGNLHLSLGESQKKEGPENLVCSLILKMAAQPSASRAAKTEQKRKELEKKYFAAFSDSKEKKWAEELLTLGRASYTFRDDDNIYLGRIEKQLNRVLHAGRKRLHKLHGQAVETMNTELIITCLNNPGFTPVKPRTKDGSKETTTQAVNSTRARQLIGQPAGPGIARGKARVVTDPSHLKDIQQGEILVCDSIDPNMTFIIPLVGGIVERRGGMLIHGAIIAREYGLACVTGIPEATNLISTGDTINVDGYLGIVTISHVKDPLA